jgi:hypothetical protein
MNVNIRLRNPLLKSSDADFGRVVRAIAEGVIVSNRLFLRDRAAKGAPVPPLYRAGIVYKNEPEGEPDQAVDIPTIVARGWGDCLHLSCWRVAELREQYERARIKVSWQHLGDGKRLFHVLVRRGNNKLEDPSKILGMKT